jgi:hypothetical protein
VVTLMFLLFILSMTGAMRRAARRRRERERLAIREQREAHGPPDGMGPSPFAGVPFGSVLEQMMRGGGGWTRAIEYDPQSGEWVDVTDAAPEPQLEADRPPSQSPPRATILTSRLHGQPRPRQGRQQPAGMALGMGPETPSGSKRAGL